MNLSRAFSAPFEDREWTVKIGLGGLFGLLIVTMPAQFGAQMAYIRSVANGNEELPSWSDFGQKWINGFLLLVGMTIYMLPAIILMGIPFFIGVSGLLYMEAGQPEPEALANNLAMICLLNVIAIAWIIAASIVFYAGMVNFSLTSKFGSMFALGEIMGHIRSRTGYFKAWAVSLLVAIVAGIAASILMMVLIGYIVAPWIYFISYLFIAHYFGQWAKIAYDLNPNVGSAVAAPVNPAPPTPPTPPSPPAPPATPTAPE